MATEAEVASETGLSTLALRVLAAAGADGAPPEQAVVARTQSEAAQFFGVSRRTIAEWMATGCPGNHKNGYPIMKMLAWRRSRDDESSWQPGGQELPDRRPTGDLARAIGHSQLIQVANALDRIRKRLGAEVADAVEEELRPTWFTPEEVEIVIRELAFLI